MQETFAELGHWDGFEEFYAAYPRRVAKLAALKAYIKAIKVTTPDVIIAGARRYARERQGQDDQFTKHPSTWLNGGCWNDKPKRNGGVIGALDRLEQYLGAREDDRASGADDFLGLPPR
jgi:hypothetical protein